MAEWIVYDSSFTTVRESGNVSYRADKVLFTASVMGSSVWMMCEMISASAADDIQATSLPCVSAAVFAPRSRM